MNTNRKYFIIGISLLLAVGYGLFILMKSPTYQIAGEIIPRVDTGEKIVALTFDDGPNGKTNEILRILAEKQVKATFYLIGIAINDSIETAAKIVEANHEIGNHSYSHQRMVFKSPQFIDQEIQATNTLIRQIGYQGDITFRPPFGKKLFLLPYYLHTNQIKTVTWDIDPLQTLPATATAEEIRGLVVQQVKPGSIILLHPWYQETNPSRQAIPLIIDSLKADGYRFVTVSELLATTSSQTISER